MGEAKLKHFFGADIVNGIADDIAASHSGFDKPGFCAQAMEGLDSLELLPRGWHIAEALHAHLPGDFPRAAAILTASLGPEIPATGQNGMAPFRYLPHVFFVQKYGLEHFDAAMQAQDALTRRFSCESSIRPYLERYPQQTLAQLGQWARHDNAHLRRLVSEGTRPRLPWAPRLRSIDAGDPAVMALLETLRDDPALYVRRSVANHLNDITKLAPEIALETCRRWLLDASHDRRWLVTHALRDLVKKGNAQALDLMGAGVVPDVVLSGFAADPAQITLGDTVRFSFTLTSRAASAQELLVDFAVDFVKANGDTRPKVFKLKRLILAPGQSVQLSGRVSLAEMTTRSHYPGRHTIEARINGVPFPLGGFQVLPRVLG